MKDINLTNLWKDFAIFPCVPKEKYPATKNGFYDAKFGQDVMSFINRGYNVAMACEMSNVIVIDLDCHKDEDTPEQDLQPLEAKLGKLPRTLTQSTARGNGKHLIFSSKGIVKPIGGIGNYIDIKWNGYCMISPSIFKGKQYEVIDGVDNNGKAILAELPQTWVDYLNVCNFEYKQQNSKKKHKNRTTIDGDFKNLYEKCNFVKHCVDDSEILKEPEWFRFACILNDFDNGFELFDKYSQDYQKYDFQETKEKYNNAKNYSFNCNSIMKIFKGCESCKHRKEY